MARVLSAPFHVTDTPSDDLSPAIVHCYSALSVVSSPSYLGAYSWAYSLMLGTLLSSVVWELETEHRRLSERGRKSSCRAPLPLDTQIPVAHLNLDSCSRKGKRVPIFSFATMWFPHLRTQFTLSNKHLNDTLTSWDSAALSLRERKN